MRSAPARWSVTLTKPPDCVNLTALLIRFQIICCSRCGSPTICPTPGSDLCSREMFLASAAGRITSTASLMTIERSSGTISSFNLPLIMRAVSSKSLINSSCALPFRSMISTVFLICEASIASGGMVRNNLA